MSRYCGQARWLKRFNVLLATRYAMEGWKASDGGSCAYALDDLICYKGMESGCFGHCLPCLEKGPSIVLTCELLHYWSFSACDYETLCIAVHGDSSVSYYSRECEVSIDFL